MNVNILVLIAFLTLHGCSATNSHLSKNIKVISTTESPCSALSFDEKTHMVQKTRPLEIELSLKINATTLFNGYFGKGAHQAASHVKEFKCIENSIASLAPLLNVTFNALEAAASMRSGTDANDRKRRSPMALPLALSVSSLLATTTVALYFGKSLKELQRYIMELDARMNIESSFADTIASNVRTLHDNEHLVGLKLNILSDNFNDLERFINCAFYKLEMREKKIHLYSHLNLLTNDIIGGKLTPRVIPLDLLNIIAKETNFIKGTLLEKDPLIFYQQGSISLLSVDRKTKKIRILLAIPKIEAEPSYISMSSTSLKAVVLEEGKPSTRNVEYPVGLHIPMNIYEQSTVFPLYNDSVFSQIKRIGNCMDVDKKKICTTIIQPERSDIECIRSLVNNKTSAGSCVTHQRLISSVPGVISEQGTSGLLLNTADSLTIFGRTGNEMTRVQTMTGSHHEHRRLCVYVPSKYDEIRIRNGSDQNNDIVFKQRISTSIDAESTLAEMSAYFVDSSYFKTKAEISNVTLASIEAMVRQKLSHGFMGTGITIESYLILAVSVCLGFVLFFLLGLKRGWFSLGPKPTQNIPMGATGPTRPN